MSHTGMQNPRKPATGTLLWGLIFVLVCVMGGGCQSPRERHVYSPLPVDLFPTGEQRFLPGEEITFRFPEGTNYTARVNEDGTISLPLVGVVKAEGKTLSELQTEVSNLYVPRFYKRWPNHFPEQRVYFVSGEVRLPGQQVYLGRTTVTKAIQSAGDFTEFAAGTRVKLLRASGEVVEVNCLKLHSPDPPVYPGDKITVPKRTFWDSFR